MLSSFFFFFNDTAPTEIYTLSLHDALPISASTPRRADPGRTAAAIKAPPAAAMVTVPKGTAINAMVGQTLDRKSTRLNSSHGYISYAVFCLKKKKKKQRDNT